jgi:hypothetical protein
MFAITAMMLILVAVLTMMFFMLLTLFVFFVVAFFLTHHAHFGIHATLHPHGIHPPIMADRKHTKGIVVHVMAHARPSHFIAAHVTTSFSGSLNFMSFALGLTILH